MLGEGSKKVNNGGAEGSELHNGQSIADKKLFEFLFPGLNVCAKLTVRGYQISLEID